MLAKPVRQGRGARGERLRHAQGASCATRPVFPCRPEHAPGARMKRKRERVHARQRLILGFGEDGRSVGAAPPGV